MSFVHRRKMKKPREKHEARIPKPFLAKGKVCGGLRGCPDLRRFADHSGGTVADFHGLPHFPNVLNVKSSLWCGMASVNTRGFLGTNRACAGSECKVASPPNARDKKLSYPLFS
jgi:hypothetical protein